MAKVNGYSLVISDGEYGEDTEAFISKALSNKHVLKWAYILHNRDVYTEYDRRVYALDLNRNLADGYEIDARYASVDEYIEDKLNSFHKAGDKKESLWRLVFVTDGTCTDDEVSSWFNKPSYMLTKENRNGLLYALEGLTRNEPSFDKSEYTKYSDDEVKTNFNYREYINELKKTEKLDLFRSFIDPAMIVSLLVFTFIIVVAIKLSTTNTGVNPWVYTGIVGGIGLLYLILNIASRIKSKKEGRFISGIPFISGAHLLVAGLISPVKWLALLCVLDFTIWMFLASVLCEHKE